MGETVHVLPLEDLKPHIEAGEYCHCKPRVVQYSDGVMVVHNSYDGREFYEEKTERCTTLTH